MPCSSGLEQLHASMLHSPLGILVLESLSFSSSQTIKVVYKSLPWQVNGDQYPNLYCDRGCRGGENHLHGCDHDVEENLLHWS